MKRIIITSTLVLAVIANLSGCSAEEAPPTPQSTPSGIADVQTQDLYRESSDDSNMISHWVFDQKMPDGTTVTCVAARWGNSSNISISCPALPKQ